MEVENVVSSLTRVADGDVVAGYATTHYRIELSYDVLIDDPRLVDAEHPELSRPHSTMVHDWWVGRVDGLPPKPAFQHGSPVVAANAGNEIAAIFRSTFDRILIEGTLLRSTTAMKSVIAGVEHTGGTEMLVSDIAYEDIELSRLTLPADLRHVDGGLPLEPGFFDRWRNPPSPSPPAAG